MVNKLFEVNQNSERRYYYGWINRIIRWYYYFTEGMAQMNAARTIAYALIGIAGVLAIGGQKTLSLHNILILGAITLILIPILCLIGFLWATRGKKSTEYYQMRFTSVFGKYGIEMSERQIEQHDRIIELLEQLVSSANDKKI